MAQTGSETTTLVVLRGNSASGKSTTARALRELAGRGTAWVEQDYLRRIVLREHDLPAGVNIGLIDQTVRYALDHGYDVVLDGILFAAHYGAMLRQLADDHLGATTFYYFDLTLDESLRRHATRPLAAEVGADQVRRWYVEGDLLGVAGERLIGADSTLEMTTRRIGTETGLWRPDVADGFREKLLDAGS